MTNEEILKEAAKVSKSIADAIDQDWISKGQPVPRTIIEIIKFLHTPKKSKS